MASASRLHVRPRGVAAITALLFVVGGLLAMRHEATTGHVRDRAGAFLHGKALTGHHAGNDSDIHGQRTPEADAGDCALLTTFHQAARAELAAPAVVAAVQDLLADDAPRVSAVIAVIDVYRLAPKTSPPVA